MSEPKKKMKLISNILAGITGAFVVFLLGLQMYGQFSARTNYGIPVYGNKQVLVVLTDSMEPNYKVGTALFVEKISDYSTIKPSSDFSAHDGDVLTFWSTRLNAPVTHRVVDVMVDDDGKYIFSTLGDNLNAVTCPIVDEVTGEHQCDPLLSRDTVYEGSIIGKVIGQSRAFGNVYRVMSNSAFILIFAIVPLFFVFLSSIVDLVKQLKPQKAAQKASEDLELELMKIKEQEKLKVYIELEKEKMRQELEDSGGNKDE